MTTEKKPRKKLTMKQELFAQKYVESHGNGTQSALEVYDTTDDKTAQVIASENLSKPIVNERIQELTRAIAVSCSDLLTREQMLQQAISQAHDIITQHGKSPDRNDQAMVTNARKFILDAYRTFNSCDQDTKQVNHLHAHKLFPARNK